jgi:class 3 adenylate cyclase
VTTFGVSHEGSPPFLGRGDELAWLRSRLDLARRGYGHLVLLEGEAGVGKTRLSHEVLDEARNVGVRVIRGRCYEHLDLAYLPLRDGLFATLARRLSSQPDRSADLDVLLGARLDEGGKDPDGRLLDEKRTRRMLALTALVMDLAHEHFLVLFIDDIDWADGATSELLRHVLFRLDDEDVPFLALVTSRGDPAARGAADVARLRGDPRAATLSLHSLTPLEATELARAARPGVTLEEARRLATAGRGNPLLVESLARAGDAASLNASAMITGGHPLLAAIDTALGQLDEHTSVVVRAAAFLVPYCTRDLLRDVVALDSGDLDRAVAHAVDARVLVDERGELTFSHPLYPHTVRAQVGPASRRELHARIATILLARHLAGEDIGVRRVAHHLVQAEGSADPAVVFDYAHRAANDAMAVAAWEEAARYYEAAIGAAPSGVAPDELVMLYRLAGFCQRAALDLPRAVRHFQDAITLLGPDGDRIALAELHLWRIRCAAATQAMQDVAHDQGPLEDLVDAIEDERPDLAAEGLVELAQSSWVQWDLERSETAARRALAIADRHDDHESYARAATQLCVPLWARYDLHESLSTLEEGVRHAQAAGSDSILAGGPLFRVPLVLTWLGRFDDARKFALECCEHAERVQYPLEEGLPLAALAQLAVACGDFDEAERRAHQALLIQRLYGYHWASGLCAPPLMAAHVARGRWAGARAALTTWQEIEDGISDATIQMLSRYVDASERGHPVEGRALPRLPRVPTLGVDTWAAAAVEIARLEGAAHDIDRAYRLLGEIDARGGVVVSGLAMLVRRLLGVAADLSGDEASAREYLYDAIALAQRLGAEPELARAQLDLATILLRRGERREAHGLLDDAVAVFERLAMTPDRERAERLAGGHGARSALRDSAVTTESVVILFSDVVDSTRHTEELGATRYRALAREVEELVMSTIVAHGGNVVTGLNLGDGFIGLFPSTRRAVAAARQCADTVGETGLHLHLAVHAGEVIVDAGRIYGGPVNYAARLCALTGPDEIIVSDGIRAALTDADNVAFVDRGQHDLKGIEGLQHVWSVLPPRQEVGAPA